MNIDLSSNTGFNDRQGLQNFLLVHRFVHVETANALTAKFNVPISTFGLDSVIAEEAWLKLMAEAKPGAPVMRQWPPESSASRSCSTTARWPMTTLASSASTRARFACKRSKAAWSLGVVDFGAGVVAVVVDTMGEGRVWDE
jgi:hypothetical protein